MTDTVPPPPGTDYRFTVRIDLQEGWYSGFSGGGTGHITPVVGGEVTGRLSGIVLPVGADWSRRVGGTSRLDARWVIRTTEGMIVQIHTSGYYRTTEEAQARIAAGEAVSTDEHYFRMVSEFDSDDPALAWLTETQFIGLGEEAGASIIVHYYAVQ